MYFRINQSIIHSFVSHHRQILPSTRWPRFNTKLVHTSMIFCLLGLMSIKGISNLQHSYSRLGNYRLNVHYQSTEVRKSVQGSRKSFWLILVLFYLILLALLSDFKDKKFTVIWAWQNTTNIL